MLHRIQPPSPKNPSLPISQATFPAPFPQTLEYSPAARGTWNIVHTGMLLPKSHQIYICASGCLRGVILTAAEMGESYYRRFHTLELQETDLYATDPETFLIEGITTILQRLPELPPAVLTFTACVHHFLGVNLPYVYRTLRHRFPTVAFAECIMDPIRQTKSIPPEVRERLEIARLLKPSSPTTESATSPKADSEQSEYFRPLGAPCSAKTFHPSGGRGLCDSERSGEHPSGAEKNRNAALKTAPTTHLESHEIAREDSPLSESAQSPRPTATSNAPSRPSLDLRERLALLELRFESLRSQLEDTPLALDSTFTPLPFSLARLLVSHHLSVTEIYADTIAPDDEQNFRWLQRCAPSIRLYPTKHPAMRTQPREHLDASGRLPIALGQKAAYFTGTHHFLPEIEAGGHYGLEAIHWLQTTLSRAALLETDPEPILKKKAWGAPSCI